METDMQQLNSATQILLRNATNTTAKMSYDKAVEQNGGVNLLSADKSSTKHFVRIETMGYRSLMRDETSFFISASFLDSSFSYAQNFTQFLKEVADIVSIPAFQLTLPKKYTNTSYRYDSPYYHFLSYKTKDALMRKQIDVESVEFKISRYAQEKLDEMGVDIKKEVLDLLSLQRKPTKQELADVITFFNLCDELQLINASFNSIGLFALPLEDYNAKIQQIKAQFDQLAVRLPYLHMPDLYNYKLVHTLPPFEDWKMDNEDDLAENWANMDSEEQEQYEDFDDYCLQTYSDFDDRCELKKYNLNDKMEADEEQDFEEEEEFEEE